MSILDELNDLFEEVKDQEQQEFEDIPAGTYSGILKEVTYKEANKNGQPFCMAQFVIDGGEYDLKTHGQYFGLLHAKPEVTKIWLSVFSNFAKSLGVDVSKGLVSTIEQLTELSGVEVVFEIKRNDNNFASVVIKELC